MNDLPERVNNALLLEEVKIERLASHARGVFLAAMTAIALLNAPTVSAQANAINFCAIVIASLYGGAVWLGLRRGGYRPATKYMTSAIDVALLHLVLFAYTLIEFPTVALKNYVFYAVYPLITLTVFRYTPRLTAFIGAWTMLLYGCLLGYVWTRIPIAWGDGWGELFGPRVSGMGQATKLTILAAFVLLSTLLARHTRRLIHKLVADEVNARAEVESIERELELAAHVQTRLLPREFPSVEGLRLHGASVQGRFVGGDYFDFIRVSDSAVLMIVADVAGKGVPAALVMAEVRASAHLCSGAGFQLETLVERLNTLLYQSTLEHGYVTLFAGLIDAAAGALHYVNAGHPPPLLHTGGVTRALEAATPPAGLFPFLPGLRAQTVALAPGSLLVACTDGVTERSGKGGEMFGDSALKGFVERHAGLECESFIERLTEEVRAYGLHRPLEDDLTLAVARFG